MEGDKFSWFAKNYLRKRPRYSPTSFPDDQMASTSACQPSTSSSSTSNNRRATHNQRILIEPSDEQLLKWQERQISKCIVDNTLNRVVESYITFWDEENVNNVSTTTRNDLEREAQLVSYHANRTQENFEDSAIMWAIDQHGLQQHNQLYNDNRTETMSTTSSSSISLSSPPRHLTAVDDLCHFNSIVGSLNHHDNHNGETSQAPTESEQLTDAKKTSDEPNQSTPQTDATTSPPNATTHFDFLETAVSVAIQEKGLTSYTMQKSPDR